MRLPLFALACLIAPAGVYAGDLAPGSAAPEFTLTTSDGGTVSLSAFRGRRAVVLAWFPKAFTPG